MAKNAKELKKVFFNLTPEVKDRLERHAMRLGLDMSTIIREGVIERIEELDEKELRALQVDNARNGRDKIPKKIERSFRRYAEFLEGAVDKVDREGRMLTLKEDVDNRTSSAEEAAAVLREFDAFMKAREAALRG